MSEPFGKDEDNALLDDIFPSEEYAAAMPPTRAFKPWHRPRKQYIRLEQWCHHIKAARNDWNLEEFPFRYLTLPGADLLDIHLIHDEFCEPHNVALRFLGFDTSANADSPQQTDLNITLYDVRRLKHVDPRSNVIGDDIRRAAEPNSLAYQRLLELGGAYHAINLDLCDGFARGGVTQTHMPTMFDLLRVLLEVQSRSLLPSLLFLTTRTNRESADEASIQKLFQAASDSLVECETYARDMSRFMQVSDNETLLGAAGEPDKFEDIFLICLFTWMLKLAALNRMELTLESVVCYKVHPSSEYTDMASVVFKLKPIIGASQDPHRLASDRYVVPRSECKSLRALVYPTKQRRDVDRMLEQDPAKLEKYTASSAALLAKVRYSFDDYITWAAAGCP